MEELAPGCMQGAGHGSYTLECQVDDVDREYARLLEIGAPIVKPPTTQPWGWRSVWFHDPDGNLVNFNAPVGAPVRKDPKDLVREYFRRVLNEKNLAAVPELLSPRYVDHDAPPDTPPGPQKPQEFLTEFLGEYPDMHVDIEDLVAEGDRVAARLTWHGRHKETGQVYHLEGIAIFRVDENGLLAERWSAYQRFE